MKKQRLPGKRKAKDRIYALLCVAVGLLLCLYPLISNGINQRMAMADIRYINAQTDSLSSQEKLSCLAAAREYNRVLASEGVFLTEPFRETQASAAASYEELLCFDTSGIMGFLEIPCIEVKLPIFHGTQEAVLQKGVGHLKGSSLPVGGESTHAVLTGHTGEHTAKLFTDLVRMKQGDLFFVTILGDKLAYCVDEIRICLPEDTGKLRIERGEDQVTLVTCTPYGVNDHRLLVRGTRTVCTEEDYAQENKKRLSDSLWMASYKKALLAGVKIAGLLLLVGEGLRQIGEARKNCRRE